MLYFYWHFIFVNINRGEFSYIFKQSTPKSDICAIDDIKQLFSPEILQLPGPLDCPLTSTRLSSTMTGAGTLSPPRSKTAAGPPGNTRSQPSHSAQGEEWGVTPELQRSYLLHFRGTKRPSNDVDCITLEETSDPVDLSGRFKKSKPSPVIECIEID